MSLSIEYSVERFAKELINFVHVEPEPEESVPVESENEVSIGPLSCRLDETESTMLPSLAQDEGVKEY